MNKWTIVGSIWMAAVASAALLAYKLNHPLAVSSFASTMSAPGDLHGEEAVDEAAIDTTVLEIPMVTIVGSLRGTAEMQGTGAVVIGPGTVTHGE